MRPRLDRPTQLAALICVAFGLVMALGVSMERSMGWDESMHAQWPAARIALGLRALDPGAALEAIHDCEKYPFGYPLLLGAFQALFGVGEEVARVLGRLLWAAGAFALFGLVREVGRARDASAPVGAAPWFAFALALASPLAVTFSGTLFLESPWASVALFALWAWLRRRRVRGVGSDLLAGALVAAAFFTKFNYGLLFGAALFVDLLVETLQRARSGEGTAALRSALCVGAPILLAFGWWFVLPLPYGPARGAQHLEVMVEWLKGNQGQQSLPTWYRWLFTTVFLHRSPVVFCLAAAGALLALGRLREAAVRTVLLVFLFLAVPIARHTFHLDRFQLPPGVFWFALAGLGWGGALRGPRGRLALGAALGLAVFVAPVWNLAFVNRVVSSATGTAVHESAEDGVRDLWRITPGRPLPTNGLARDEFDGLVGFLSDDLQAGEPAAAPRVGWVGMNTTFAPAAALVGLLERGHPAGDQLRRGDLDASFVNIGYEPGPEVEWSDEELTGWASGFGVLYGTFPVDLNRQEDRVWLHALRERLVGLGWSLTDAGSWRHVQGPGRELDAKLLVLRPGR